MVTHKDISRHCGVTEATAQRWGRNGRLGPALIKFPAHYSEEALELAEQILNGDKKVTDKQVKEIRRRAARETNASLAQAFCVSESYISRIVRNERRLAS